MAVRNDSSQRLIDLVSDGGSQLTHAQNPGKIGKLSLGSHQSFFGLVQLFDVGVGPVPAEGFLLLIL